MSGQVRLCALVVGPYFLLSGSEDTMMKASLQPDIISFNSALGSYSVQFSPWLIWFATAMLSFSPVLSFRLSSCSRHAKGKQRRWSWGCGILDQRVESTRLSQICRCFRRIVAMLRPYAVTFRSLFNLIGYGMLWQSVLEVTRISWREFPARGSLQPSEVTFGSMLDACARAGKMDKAKTWLERMAEAMLQPSKHCYTSLVKGAATKGDLALAATRLGFRLVL